MIRWTRLWNILGKPDGNEPWLRRLEALYREPHRHYHTLAHVMDCLDEFDTVKGQAKDPAALELAIWFHDAVYNSRAGDNEEQSARMATECLCEAQLPEEFIAKVDSFIIATKHHEVTDDPDCSLMVDIDLSILGKSTERFRQYEEQIRREYSWVPLEVFAGKRAEILERFLRRSQIYRTEIFRTKYEETARRNLHDSINRLRGAE